MINNQLNVRPFSGELTDRAKEFRSGNSYLDHFLRGTDSLDHNVGKTFVFLADDNATIIGYYNLGTGYVEMVDGDIRTKMGGSIHINCFALDERYHGLVQTKADDGEIIYLSDFLLRECIQRIEYIREKHIGFSFITLSSTKEGHSLYLRNGFDDLEEDMSFSVEASDVECTPMYLALDIV